MHLADEPFEWVRSGKKTVELRLYDEKRRKIKIGDTIVFKRISDEQSEVRVVVQGLMRFRTFSDLLDFVPRTLLNHEGLTKEQQLERMRRYYSKEQEEKYGVLGIWFKIGLKKLASSR